MNDWKSSLALVKRDLGSEGLYLIWNVIFMVYTGACISLWLFTNDPEAHFIQNSVIDFLMLIFTPMICFQYSRRSFRYLKDDSYTQMLLYYRSLPIPLKVIMQSRALKSLLSLAMNGTLFFATMYLASYRLRGDLNIWEFVAFALTWSGYGLLATGPYIYYEFLKSGRTYLKLSFLYMGLLLVAAVLISLTGFNIFRAVLEMSQRFGLLSPLMWGSLLVGAAGLWFTCKVTVRKLGARDLV
ncbi:hypothetical protein DCC85_02855 [Paenibacillus sp. CAA11]|nr:hypothetical protein DCC85_02855 [Paenibacillus sp. CAA11]